MPVDGRSLEGVGVAPHRDVDYVIPYAMGRDPIFDKGVDVAVEQVRVAERKRRLRPM